MDTGSQGTCWPSVRGASGSLKPLIWYWPHHLSNEAAPLIKGRSSPLLAGHSSTACLLTHLYLHTTSGHLLCTGFNSKVDPYRCAKLHGRKHNVQTHPSRPSYQISIYPPIERQIRTPSENQWKLGLMLKSKFAHNVDLVHGFRYTVEKR